MRAFYSMNGTSAVRRVHVLREGRARPRPKWRTDKTAVKEGWCGTMGWDRSDGVGRFALDQMPLTPPAGFTWCPACIGHVLEELGMIGAVATVAAVAAKQDGDTP